MNGQTEARALLESGIAALGVEPAAADPLWRYVEELQWWNPYYGLLAADDADPMRIVARHILDSLAALPVIVEQLALPFGAAVRLVDIGSGAGLPGIPLHIAMRAVRPTRTTLIERMGRREQFLRAVAARLAFDDLQVVQADIYELSRGSGNAGKRAVLGNDPQSGGEPLVIIFRAFTALDQRLLRALRRVCGSGALLCAYKGRVELAERELHELRGLGVGLNAQVKRLDAPFADGERSVIVVNPIG